MTNDLLFWLPELKDDEIDAEFRTAMVEQNITVPRAPKELYRLPDSHFGRVLLAVVKIYRKGRKRDGNRYPNSSIRDFVFTVQRLARAFYREEFLKTELQVNAPPERQIDFSNGPGFTTLMRAVDTEMKDSANQGLVRGLVKAKRDDIPPNALAKVFLLKIVTPIHLELKMSGVMMFFCGVRGGLELSEHTHWGMFKRIVNMDGDLIMWIYNPNMRQEKNHQGGLKDWRKDRKTVELNVLDGDRKALSPGWITELYWKAQPEGWADPEKQNRIFLKAKPKFSPTGIGFYAKNYRGHSYMSHQLQRMLNKTGTAGHYTNQQGRAKTIQSLLEGGISVQEVMKRVGHNNPASVCAYFEPSRERQKHQTEVMVDGLLAGQWGAKPERPALPQPPAHPGLPQMGYNPLAIAPPPKTDPHRAAIAAFPSTVVQVPAELEEKQGEVGVVETSGRNQPPVAPSHAMLPAPTSHAMLPGLANLPAGPDVSSLICLQQRLMGQTNELILELLRKRN